MNAHGESAALRAACNSGVMLATIVGIQGSFSRRLGSQLAIGTDGTITGSLADGCLERQLASDLAHLQEPVVRRYGAGSTHIDFRLPCGGGLDILLDPHPDRNACREAVARLDMRQPASLVLPDNPLLAERRYIPELRVCAFGEGPELAVLAALAEAADLVIQPYDTRELTLGQAPRSLRGDRWTAIVLLFHDHEWEAAILHAALASDAFYIGAQGGEAARQARLVRLQADGLDNRLIARLRAPVGSVPGSRTPAALALSILAEIVGAYEQLQPHA